jgi:hypothetical protein
MQKHLKCCGVDGSTDWLNNTTHRIPESCCIHDTGTQCSQYSKNIFEKVSIIDLDGCLDG